MECEHSEEEKIVSNLPILNAHESWYNQNYDQGQRKLWYTVNSSTFIGIYLHSSK